jgi:hypothetical protein
LRQGRVEREVDGANELLVRSRGAEWPAVQDYLAPQYLESRDAGFSSRRTGNDQQKREQPVHGRIICPLGSCFYARRVARASMNSQCFTNPNDS